VRPAVQALVSDFQHIFVASYPEGRIKRITSENTAYFLKALSLSADGNSIFAIQRSETEEFWITAGNLKHATQLSLEGAIAQPESLNFDGQRVFYYSGVGEADGIWRSDLNGRAPVRISPANMSAAQNSLSPDGHWISFSPLRNGRRTIWVADTEGGNPRQLVDGDHDENPVFTADGKEVVFFRRGKDSGLYRVPFVGGSPTRVSDLPLGMPSSISADGRVLCQYFDVGKDSPARVAIVSLHDGSLVRVLDSPDWNSIPRLTRDGKNISYVDDSDGTSNVWSVLVQGGPSRKLTNFTSETIYEYEWSLDGRQLVFIRGTKRGEAVLIQNFRRPLQN
jgi:Tol biopolymer transport system component